MGKNNASKDSTTTQPKNGTSRWVAPQLLHDVTDRNELIFRRVRGILNKLTPENFEKLSYSLINIGIDKTVLKGIIILIYEKAIDEPKYCSIYAKLCLRLHHDVPNFDDPTKKSNTFMRLLLCKCQEEFETRSKASSAFDKKVTELSPDEQYAKQVAKRKMLGNIKFIGELGKLELLQEAILHKCIQQLLAKKRRTSLSEMAEDIECMCQIMSTIGKRLDTPKANNIMKQYFDRIEMLSKSDELPSRIRFLLKDVLELRVKKWIPRRNLVENGPRSVSQMRWEAAMGQMMPPPFPFFPPGMPLPPGMQANMPIPPFNPGDMHMPWFSDPVMVAGGIGQHTDNNLPLDYHDEHKDIFGKPVNKVPTGPPKQPASIPRLTAKPDLFEPHYMKSKSNTKKRMMNGRMDDSNSSENNKKNLSGQHESKKEKVINKSNPWNIDPFMPHFTKPSINLITQNEEANQVISKPSHSPPMKISPPTVPRTSAANTFNKPQQQPQPWKKGDKEVSLRPASFLTKKDEKPKIGNKRPEELPPKLQQFTNLTINDKTSNNNSNSNNISNKPKKSTLSKSDIDKKIALVFGQYQQDEDLSNVCNELQTITTNTKYSRMLAKQLLTFAAVRTEDDWRTMGEILMACEEKSVLSSETLINAYNQLLDDIKILERTNGKEFMAAIAALIIEKELSKLSKFMETFQDGAYFPIAMMCFSELSKTKGKEWLLTIIDEEKLDLKKLFPKNENGDDSIMTVAQEMNMSFLFPHLCLKEELLKMMEDVEVDENALIEWMKNKESTLSRKLLVHVVVTCAVIMATRSTLADGLDLTQKPDKELQEQEKEMLGKIHSFLRTFIGNDSKDQLRAVYALQVFCFEKEFPKDMLLRLFITFYDKEIIDEDVFFKWKEDLNDEFPGKGKSLFQVNSWLQWLEIADEEEDDDEEEAEANEDED